MFLASIFTTLNTSLQKSHNRVSIDRTDNDEDYLYLFLDDVDGYIGENDGIKYLVFASTDKNEAIKTLGRN